MSSWKLAGPHPHGITEGLKQQKLSPSGEDKDPPELVSDPAVGLNTRGSGSQLRRLSRRQDVDSAGDPLHQPLRRLATRRRGAADEPRNGLLPPGRVARVDPLGRERDVHVLARAKPPARQRSDQEVAGRAHVTGAREHEQLTGTHPLDDRTARAPQPAQVEPTPPNRCSPKP